MNCKEVFHEPIFWQCLLAILVSWIKLKSIILPNQSLCLPVVNQNVYHYYRIVRILGHTINLLWEVISRSLIYVGWKKWITEYLFNEDLKQMFTTILYRFEVVYRPYNTLSLSEELLSIFNLLTKSYMYWTYCMHLIIVWYI